MATLRTFCSNAPRVSNKLAFFSNASHHQKYTFNLAAMYGEAGSPRKKESIGLRHYV
jgi:hypothetical protein